MPSQISEALALQYAEAVRLFGSSRLEDARRICRSLLSQLPRNGDVLNLMGAIHHAEGSNELASRCVERALSLDKTNPHYHANRGQILRSLGRGEEGLLELLAAHSLNPNILTLEQLVSAHLSFANEMMEAGRDVAAANAMAKAIELDASAVDTKRMLIEPPARAASIYTKILENLPDNPAVLEKLAYASHFAGDTKQSESGFARLEAICANGDRVAESLHAIYSHGLLATATKPLFRRRKRFVSLLQTFASVMDVDGDVAECGCLKGLSAYVLARYWRQEDRGFDGTGFHIFDSFMGLSEITEKDRDGAPANLLPSMKKGHFAIGLETVKANLSAFPRIQYYPGWIPERFNEVSERKFRFINLDVDIYEPTLASLLFFYPRMVRGGLIISDDYNWPGCRAAIEEAKIELGFAVEVLPDTTQAVIRKQ